MTRSTNLPIEYVEGLENCICHHTNLVNIYNSSIGSQTKIGAFVEIGGAKIGKDCKIQSFVYIPPGVVIGDRVFVGPGTVFTNCKKPDLSKEPMLIETFIEDDVVIGAGCVILPGIRIKRNAFIAAGSTVTKDVGAGETWIEKGCKCKQ